MVGRSLKRVGPEACSGAGCDGRRQPRSPDQAELDAFGRVLVGFHVLFNPIFDQALAISISDLYTPSLFRSEKQYSEKGRSPLALGWLGARFRLPRDHRLRNTQEASILGYLRQNGG